MEESVHLAGHSEAALVADALLGADALRLACAVGEDEVGDPTLRFEVEFFHLAKSNGSVHDGIAAFLVVENRIEHLQAVFLVEGKVFRAGKRGVQAERDGFEIGTLLDVLYCFAHRLPVECIHSHICREGFVPASGDVLLKPFESALSSHTLVILSYPVEAHPDAVGVGMGEGFLRVGGDGAREEPKPFSFVHKVVNRASLIFPDERLAPLKVDKPASKRIAVFHLLHKLREGFHLRLRMVVHAAMLAGEIAFIGNEDDALKRFLFAEETSSHKPVREIEELEKTRHVWG